MDKGMKTSGPTQERRARSVPLILLALGALLVFVLWPRKAPRPVKPAADETAANLSPPPAPYTLRGPPVPESAEPEPAPVIDGIELEKNEVCEGEENLVTIHAHTTNGTDAS